MLLHTHEKIYGDYNTVLKFKKIQTKNVEHLRTNLLYRVEVWIIEVSEEPENTRPQHLPQHEDEGSEVEDIYHPHQPVDEQGCAGSCLEAHLSIL